MFVNGHWRGWVIGVEAVPNDNRFASTASHCSSAPPSGTVFGGFAHRGKVDVRLVSFALSGVQMTWLQTKGPLPNTASSTAVASLRSAEFLAK